MKITLMSNAPGVGSGYGQQAELLVSRLLAAGHEVAVASNYGLDGRIVEQDGYRVYPRGIDKFGISMAPAQHAHFLAPEEPDRGWMIALYDAWPLDAWGDKIWQEMKIAGWFPVDHVPAPPEVVEIARKARLVIAMSRYGQEQFTLMGVKAHYVPHSVDTSVFRPDATLAKPFRQQLEIPADAYLIGIVAANIGSTPPRKGWGEMFFALGRFMREHEDAYLYVHTLKRGINGIPLNVLEQACGLPQDRVRWVDQFAYSNGLVGAGAMAAIYASMDVHLLTSYGEGFGIPVIEAAACGTPSIVSDGSAQRELVGPGWKVGVEPFWNQNSGAFFHRPSIHSIGARLEEAYADRGNQQRREDARAFALEYDADLVFDRYWKPVLAEMEAALAAPPEAVARAERRRQAKAARRAAVAGASR